MTPMIAMTAPSSLRAQLLGLSKKIEYWRQDEKAGYDGAIELLCEVEDYLREAAAALAGPSPQWQPIETAPKDGTEILLGWSTMVLAGYWYERGNHAAWATSRGEYMGSASPTCWMPLPNVPAPPEKTP